MTVGTLLVGLMVVAILAAGSEIEYHHNESRLVTLQARITGSALSQAGASILTTMRDIAETGSATAGEATAFDALTHPEVGHGHQFATVSLWGTPSPSSSGNPVKPLVTAGVTPLIATSPAKQTAIFDRTLNTPGMSVTPLNSGGTIRLAYAVASTSSHGTYIAYAEQVLPARRRLKVQTSSPLSDLNYALYLGRSARPAELLAVSGPIQTHPTSTVVVPFGDSALTLTMSARTSLAGTFPRLLPWVISLVGVVLTALFSLTVNSLAGRRERAEQLAADNQRLFQEQRSVAETLQHSLLPQLLPSSEAFESIGRYMPGTAGIDIGGDWYDVVEVDDDHVFFAVGDVCGRGLHAATLMAGLRYAIDAYAVDGDEPEVVLAKLGRFVNVAVDGRFATVVCGLMDFGAGEIRIASAGHPPPLLVQGADATFVPLVPGLPIGVGTGTYTSLRLPIESPTTLVAFTDGLFERRTEPLSAGLDRVQRAACRDVPLATLIDGIVATLVPEGTDDDLAILGVQWN